jgi:hypothetical protein
LPLALPGHADSVNPIGLCNAGTCGHLPHALGIYPDIFEARSN